MANKPFAIQGADLTLGGVSLQAGISGVVIPGVTQAANYFVEEVDDRDGSNPDIFGSDENAVTVIDNAEYAYRSGTETPTGSYSAAQYSVDELDDGEIDGINVETGGVFLSADVANIDRGNMWATTTANPFVSFDPDNWTSIPYRPKMRAGEVENVGGNGGDYTLPTASTSTKGGVKVDGTTITIDPTTGVISSTGGDGTSSALVNGANQVVLGSDGNLTLPLGGDIVDINGDSVLGGGNGGGASLTEEGNVVVTAGSTEHWIATQRRDDYDTEPRGLRYDSLGNLYALTKSGDNNNNNNAIITKYTAAGAIAWQRALLNVDPISLAVDSNNCAYIALRDQSGRVAVVKYSTIGGILFKKTYNIGSFNGLGPFIEEKSSTTLALAFTSESDLLDFAVVMEISSTNGSIQLTKRLDADGSDVNVTGIDVDSDENVFVTGYYYDESSDKNKMFIEKLDENLGPVWSKSLETDTSYSMFGGDCASDALGNIYVVGNYSVDTVNSDGTSSQSAAVLVKLNSGGVVQWTRRIGPGPCGGFATGLTVTDAGIVYLSSVTFSKSTVSELRDDEFLQEAFGTNKLIVARYNTQGAVIWQRYVDVANLWENYDNEQIRGQAVAVFGDKFAVDGYGYSGNIAPYNFSSSDDNEDDYFVVQLPTDGTELTIGNLGFTESRVPGRFITHIATDSPLSNSAYTDPATAEEYSFIELAVDDRIANNIVNSETYEYTFGADGTLTIPNDGDLRLTQSQVGYLMAVGGSQNYNDDIYGRAVTVDSQGNMYVAGEEYDDSRPFVMKISPDGVRQWSVSIAEDVNGHSGRANGIVIHPTTGNVMVVCEMNGDYIYSILVALDQDTGHILDHEKFSDAESDVYINDIAYANLGDSALSYVLAGSKNGEFSPELTVTAQTGSTTGTIIVLRSDTSGIASNSWQISGTGISPFENIAYVNRYAGLTGTVRQGSGAVFTVTNNGDGTYTVVGGGGANYLPGHTIKILGTSLSGGGATPDNDIIITVTEVISDGIINAISHTGTASGTTAVTDSGVSGTNYQTGSGMVFTFWGPLSTTNYDNWDDYQITNGGTNYVEGDVIVFAGTSLGGTTPANDLTISVNASAGAVTGLYNFTGTGQSTTWKLETTTQVDFSQPGSWAITYPVSRQNLLVTPTWQRTFGIGSNNTDRLYAVAIDTSNNIIAVGQGFSLVSEGNTDDLAMVYKFNSAGTLQWSRRLNEKDSDCYAKSVTTIGTDIYVTHDSNDDGETVITKLDDAGVVKWQRITDSGDDSVIARTADGNLLVTAEAYNEDIDQQALKVFLLTPSGETVYKRWLMAATDENTQFKNGRCLAVDSNSYYITGYFYGNDFDSSLAARLPIDGSGTGEYGSFRYSDVNNMTGNFFGDTAPGINYSISEVDLADANNYAGALANGEQPLDDSTINVVVGTGDFYVDSYYPELTVETVRDTDGGSIVFPDGTKQSTSATDVPQRRYTGQRYTLGLKDRGHHILCTESDDTILVPYDSRVAFPVGTVITLVNITPGSINIQKEGGSTNVILAGDGSYGSFLLTQYGVATLLKVGIEQWVVSGNVTPI